ncbi:hypothetical protein VKT23_006135 [Stygiomarasmius scandens]|uniref:Uncharacterized protein n=1 Tax=Marasmiellus scandens TaxID=2682957 RepID=A0ABR1JSM5_9AGAR
MSWAWVAEECPNSSIVLFAGSWMWTMWYDTIYASQDKKDDIKAGVKSSALYFGSTIRKYLVFFGSSLVLSLIVSGIMNNQTLVYYAVSVVGGALHLLWQLNTVNFESPKSCFELFHANALYFGGVVETGLLLDYLLASN